MAGTAHDAPRGDRPRWTLIANPAAGGGTAAARARAALEQLRRAGQPAQLQLTSAPGHAGELARAALAAGGDTVVVCGGDGTVSEVLPALAGTEAVLGLLPCGTGNDLARSLGLPRSPERAVAHLLAGTPRRIDLGRCGGRWFATVAAFGFDAEVNQLVAASAGAGAGTTAYLRAALGHLRRFRPPRVRLRGDFGQLEISLFLAAVANTASYGGGLRIAPDADPTDGCFDVCLVEAPLPMASVLGLMPRLFWGGHVNSRRVRVLRTRRLELEPVEGRHVVYADGEPLAATPVSLTVAGSALRVRLWAGAARDGALA